MKNRWFLFTLWLSISLISCDSILQNEDAPATVTPIVMENPDVIVTAALMTTATMTPTTEPTRTQIPPTATLQNAEPTLEKPGEDNPTDEPQDDPLWLFKIQTGSPAITQSWLHGCDWFGVAGQVFDLDGNPMDKIIVETGGLLGDEEVLGLSLTGRDLDYGPGGYEIQLPGVPTASTATVWVQLKDVSGAELSPKIFIDTHENCGQNLNLLNFIANDLVPDTILFFPILNP